MRSLLEIATVECGNSSASGIAAPEMLAIAVASVSLLLAEVLYSDPHILFSRCFWIDELYTKLVQAEPSVRQSMIALKHSGDLTPPTYYLLARLFLMVPGLSPEIAFRTLSFISTWVALLFTYAILRRSFAMLPAVVAVLALWSSPTIIENTFLSRSYAPLLACTAAFCFIYTSDIEGPIAAVLIAAFAALVCTIHYFGLFSLLSIVGGDLLRRRAPRVVAVRLLLVATGPLALMACLPFVESWFSGLAVYSYSPALTFKYALAAVLGTPGGSMIISSLLVVAACGLSALVQQLGKLVQRRTNPVIGYTGFLRSVAGLSGLIMVPLFLAVCSVMRCNVMLPRYMIAGLLGITPILALVASGSSAPVLLPTALIIVALGAWEVRIFAEQQTAWQADQESMLRIGNGDDLPIVTFSDHEAYVLYEYAPDVRRRLIIADLRGAGHLRPSKILTFDEELARKWSLLFPDLPKLVSLDRLRYMGRFHVVPSELPILAGEESHPALKYQFRDITGTLSFTRVQGSIYEIGQGGLNFRTTKLH